MAQKTYRIGDVANLMGLSRDTLRYYEKQNGRRKNGNPAPSANHGPIKSNQ